MTVQETELAIIITELAVMIPLWKTLAKQLARVVAFFKIPVDEPTKEHS